MKSWKTYILCPINRVMKDTLYFALTLLFLLSSVTVNAKTHQNSLNLIGHGGPVNAVSISSNGENVLSGSLDYAVMLWNISKPQPTNTKRFITH